MKNNYRPTILAEHNIALSTRIRENFSRLDDFITQFLPTSRERAIVITKLEEAFRWAIATVEIKDIEEKLVQTNAVPNIPTPPQPQDNTAIKPVPANTLVPGTPAPATPSAAVPTHVPTDPRELASNSLHPTSPGPVSASSTNPTIHPSQAASRPIKQYPVDPDVGIQLSDKLPPPSGPIQPTSQQNVVLDDKPAKAVSSPTVKTTAPQTLQDMVDEGMA